MCSGYSTKYPDNHYKTDSEYFLDTHMDFPYIHPRINRQIIFTCIYVCKKYYSPDTQADGAQGSCCIPKIDIGEKISIQSILTNFADREYGEGRELEKFGEEVCAKEAAKSRTNNPNLFAECVVVLSKVRATVDSIRQLVSGDDTIVHATKHFCELFTDNNFFFYVSVHIVHCQPCSIHAVYYLVALLHECVGHEVQKYAVYVVY